jgi:hypothetical protein
MGDLVSLLEFRKRRRDDVARGARIILARFGIAPEDDAPDSPPPSSLSPAPAEDVPLWRDPDMLGGMALMLAACGVSLLLLR